MDTYDLVGKIKEKHGIQDPDNEDALTNAQCLDWINQARRTLQEDIKLRFCEFEDTDVVSASSRTSALPTGFMFFTSLYYIDDDGDLAPITWFTSKRQFDKKFPDRTLEGTVNSATQWGNAMILGLVPDAEITIYRSGLKVLADLVYGADETDDFLDECWQTIMWEALILSGEHATVPEQKHKEWKDQAARGRRLLRLNYRTAKVRPERIVSKDIGTLITAFEEA